MSSPRFESFLARLYADDAFRGRFLEDPEKYGRAAGLSGDELRALQEIDRDGLELAAASFARKRAAKEAHAPRPRAGFWRRLLRLAR